MTDNNRNDPFGPTTFDRHRLLYNSANVGKISWTTIFKMAQQLINRSKQNKGYDFGNLAQIVQK